MIALLNNPQSSVGSLSSSVSPNFDRPPPRVCSASPIELALSIYNVQMLPLFTTHSPLTLTTSHNHSDDPAKFAPRRLPTHHSIFLVRFPSFHQPSPSPPSHQNRMHHPSASSPSRRRRGIPFHRHPQHPLRASGSWLNMRNLLLMGSLGLMFSLYILAAINIQASRQHDHALASSAAAAGEDFPGGPPQFAAAAADTMRRETRAGNENAAEDNTDPPIHVIFSTVSWMYCIYVYKDVLFFFPFSTHFFSHLSNQ